MKVRELIELLESEDDKMEILFKPTNSSYVENFSVDIYPAEVNRFYGDPREYLIIDSEGQIGSV